MKTLTYKQKVTVNCFLSGMNMSDAYRRGYNTSRMKSETVNRRAFEFFESGKIAAIVEAEKKKALERTHATLDEVLSLMAESLRVDPLEVFDDQGRIKPLKDIPVRVRRAMTSIKIEEGKGGMFGGTTTIKDIKFNSKVPIMDMFMKKYGDYAASKFEVEDVTPISSKISAAEAKEIGEKLDGKY